MVGAVRGRDTASLAAHAGVAGRQPPAGVERGSAALCQCWWLASNARLPSSPALLATRRSACRFGWLAACLCASSILRAQLKLTPAAQARALQSQLPMRFNHPLAPARPRRGGQVHC